MKHLLPTLEEITFGIMSKCISSDGQDVLEDVLQLLAYFTYFGGGAQGAAGARFVCWGPHRVTGVLGRRKGHAGQLNPSVATAHSAG